MVHKLLPKKRSQKKAEERNIPYLFAHFPIQVSV